jgi:MFS family permease
VTGALIAAAAVFLLSRIPVQGHYASNLLPGLMLMSIGLGAVFVGVTTAANAGVPADKSGLAAGLVNTSQWLGAALGLAIFTAIATARTNHLVATHAGQAYALTQGFHQGLLYCSIFLAVAAVIALRATNTRGEAAEPQPELATDPRPQPDWWPAAPAVETEPA